MSSHSVTVQTDTNDEVTDQIDNLSHTYAALLLVRDYRPKSPEQVRAILPQVMYFCTETSAAHSLLEYDDSTGRHGRLTPHLLRFRTVIAHAVNVVVAECVRRFGDCANDGSSGYWATVPQLALSTSASASAIKPYPHLFTDHCFAHLMVAYRSPDWQVVRQVTVVILNLLEERLIYGIDAYESSHLRDGASEEERLALKFAPITETQLCTFHDVAFQMLCAFAANKLSFSAAFGVCTTLWSKHSARRKSCIYSLRAGLRGVLDNFPRSVKGRSPSMRCLEMLSCQRLYFLAFWFKVAHYYESASLRRF